MKIQRLEKLCRALQTERNDLNKRVQDLSAGGQGPLTDNSPEQRPEADIASKEQVGEGPRADGEGGGLRVGTCYLCLRSHRCEKGKTRQQGLEWAKTQRSQS